MLRSDLFDYSDAYIVVKGTVRGVRGASNNDRKNRDLVLKSNALFISFSQR